MADQEVIPPVGPQPIDGGVIESSTSDGEVAAAEAAKIQENQQLPAAEAAKIQEQQQLPTATSDSELAAAEAAKIQEKQKLPTATSDSELAAADAAKIQENQQLPAAEAAKIQKQQQLPTATSDSELAAAEAAKIQEKQQLPTATSDSELAAADAAKIQENQQLPTDTAIATKHDGDVTPRDGTRPQVVGGSGSGGNITPPRPQDFTAPSSSPLRHRRSTVMTGGGEGSLAPSPVPSDHSAHGIVDVTAIETAFRASINAITAAITASATAIAANATGGSPPTPLHPPTLPLPPGAVTVTVAESPPQLINCVTFEQKKYIEQLENKRSRLQSEQMNIDQRSDQVELYMVNVLGTYLLIITGGLFINGGNMDAKTMHTLLVLLAIAFVAGAAMVSWVVYLKLDNFNWSRVLINRKRMKLLGLVEQLEDQISDPYQGVLMAPSYTTMSLEHARTRLDELKSTLESETAARVRKLFWGIVVILIVCIGLMVYWTFVISTGKLDTILFGRRVPTDSYSAT